MDQNILDAIQKSLPAMQMDALKKELEKATMHDKLMSQLTECQKENSALRYERDGLKKLEVEMKTEKEKAQLMQRDFELLKVKHELECQKGIVNAVTNLAMAAFRNPTITKSFNRNIPLKNTEYASGSTMSENSFETETID
jgi:molecular chaperone GrpE (heat shock protein)